MQYSTMVLSRGFLYFLKQDMEENLKNGKSKINYQTVFDIANNYTLHHYIQACNAVLSVLEHSDVKELYPDG